MLSYKEVTGDILSPNSNPQEAVAVCHQVNCEGLMGAGLALQVRRLFPRAFDAYRNCCDELGRSCLGMTQCYVALEPYNYVLVNLFGQEGYGKYVQRTDYAAVEKALGSVNKMFRNCTVRIPYHMGCGLGGGDWNIVLSLVESTLTDCHVQIWRL